MPGAIAVLMGRWPLAALPVVLGVLFAWGNSLRAKRVAAWYTGFAAGLWVGVVQVLAGVGIFGWLFVA